MKNQKVLYILTGMLITMLCIGGVVYLLNPALADDIYIPVVGGTDSVNSSSVKPAPVDSTVNSTVPDEKDDSDTFPDGAPRNPRPDQIEPGRPMSEERRAEFMKEVTNGADLEGTSITMTVEEIYGKRFQLGGVEFVLPENIRVKSDILFSYCSPQKVVEYCPQAPMLLLTDGNKRYAYIERRSGKVIVSVTESETDERLEESFGFLREQVKPGNYIVVHPRSAESAVNEVGK